MFVTVAQSTDVPPPAPSFLGMLLPFIVLGTTFGVVLAIMARRKGRNPFLWFAIAFIPLAGPFAGLYLASLPDVALLERLWALEDKLAKLSSNANPPQLPLNS